MAALFHALAHGVPCRATDRLFRMTSIKHNTLPPSFGPLRGNDIW